MSSGKRHTTHTQVRLCTYCPARVTTGAFLITTLLSLLAACPAFGALPEFQQGGAGVGAGKGFTGAGTGAKTIEFVKADGNLVCTAEENKFGSTKNATEVAKVVLRFTGCSKGAEGKCKSPVAANGTVETNALVGKLGYLNKAKTEAGLLYSPEGGGTVVTEYSCEKESIFCLFKKKIEGSVIGQITTVNKEEEKWTTVFEIAAGLQQWVNFEKESPPTHELKVGNKVAVLVVEEALTWSNNEKIKIAA